MTLSSEQKKDLLFLLAGTALLLLAVLLPLTGWARLLAFLVPCLVAGREVFREAAEGLLHGELLDENFLMALASLGALAVGEYPEAVLVLLLYCVGEFFEDLAVDRSRSSIAALTALRPDSARVERGGETVTVSPAEVLPGEVLIIRAGERIPLDGVVLEGVCELDTSSLTGESLPRTVAPGDTVLSGCVDLTGLLRVRAVCSYENSTAERILALTESCAERRAGREEFITRFARWYTPAVVAAAVLLAVLPPLLGALPWGGAVRRALTFLVVSCPCALVVSVPLAFFSGIGGASRRGILIKGGIALEALAAMDTAVFDKTGTLTRGVFTVTDVRPAPGFSPEELLTLAALAEGASGHPIALALRTAAPAAGDRRVTDAQALPGLGACAVIDGVEVLAGNAALLASRGISLPDAPASGGTLVHASRGGVYAGSILLEDVLKPDAAQAVASLRRLGVTRTVVLTGDRPEAARAVGETLAADEVHAGLLPADKVEHVEALLAGRTGKGTLAFIGDGVNDSPVLARADLGIAMGVLGSDAAIESADVVLMDDSLARLPEAVAHARRTVRIVRENIVLSLTVKLLLLVLGALGLTGMGLAVFGDVGVLILAVLNAMRARKGVSV